MGWLPIIFGIVASYLFWNIGNYTLLTLTIIFVIGTFWSWGIMHNYATEKAKKRSSYSGKFYDFTESEVTSVPNWITTINMIMTLLVLIMLIVGIRLKLT